MSETILTLQEVRSRLRELQRKYGCSNREFLSNPEVRNRVSDEDSFEWEAYLTHADAMREYEEELRREYLNRVVAPSEPVAERDKVTAQLALAA